MSNNINNLLLSGYVKSVDILLDEIPNETNKIVVDDMVFNPSLISLGNGYLVTARHSNATRVRDLDFNKHYTTFEHYNKNYLLFYNKKNELISKKLIDDTAISCLYGDDFHGIEDIRLYKGDGIVSGICNSVYFRDSSWYSNQVTFHLQDNIITEPQVWSSPVGSKLEKNWVPLVNNGKNCICYSINPFVCFEIDGFDSKIISGSLPVNNFKILGGTPFVALNDVWIAVAHYPAIFHDKMYYVHCFVVVDKSMELIEISDSFFIKRRGIEFACGLDIDGDDLLLSFGVSDRAAYFSKFRIENLKKYLVCI